MQEHTTKPNELPIGFYWYFENGHAPVVVEKKNEEAFVRFTNGRRQPWIAAGEKFVGPIPVPV